MTTLLEYAARRAALIAALRSGRYSQTKHHLHDAGGMCCLGVAEDLRGCEWQPQTDSSSVRGIYIGELETDDGGSVPDFETENLTLAGMEYYGFHTWSGEFNNPVKLTLDDVVFSLQELNDDGWGFRQIADFIESNPAGLWEEGTF